MSLPITSEIAKLAGDALVALYVLDAQELGGGVFRFIPQTKEITSPVMWQGLEYTAIPMEARDFEMSGQGAPPRPGVTFANLMGSFTALVLTYDDLVGAKFTRKRTFAKYMDGMPGANPQAAFPDDIFFIDRKVTENRFMVEFELSSSLDVEDVALPRRQVIANLCPWRYRGGECGYSGDIVKADIYDGLPDFTLVNKGLWDNATTYHAGDYVYIVGTDSLRRYFWCHSDNDGAGIIGDAYPPTQRANWTADQCGKKPRSCEIRFPFAANGLPYGGFPSTASLNR